MGTAHTTNDLRGLGLARAVSKVRGLVAAVLAYTAWGPLAPLGALLLDATGPFTLNVLRTTGAIVLFGLVYGPKTVRRALQLVRRDRRIWILGGVGLGFTFGCYLTSLRFLEPTIAALMIYLSPILVVWVAHYKLGESASPLLWPTIALTLVGGVLAVVEPSAGFRLGRLVPLGLLLGILGAGGWTFYTVYLKRLTREYGDAELTLGAFFTSGAVFLALAVPFERFHVEISGPFLWEMLVYIVFPSFVAFQLYAMAVRNAGATIVSVLIGIEVFATAVFSYFLTGEQFHFNKVLGLVLVLGAVTVFLAFEGRASSERPTAQQEGHEGRPDGEPRGEAAASSAIDVRGRGQE